MPFLGIIMIIKLTNILSILHKFSKLSVCTLLIGMPNVNKNWGKKISAYARMKSNKQLTHMQLPSTSSFPSCPSPHPHCPPVSSLNIHSLVTQHLCGPLIDVKTQIVITSLFAFPWASILSALVLSGTTTPRPRPHHRFSTFSFL